MAKIGWRAIAVNWSKLAGCIGVLAGVLLFWIAVALLAEALL
jgi:hypothetical protein